MAEAEASDCGVCLGGYEADESPELYHVTVRKARKPHQCCECKEEIQPGQKYEYVVALYDGDFTQFLTCLACQDIRDSLSCDGSYCHKTLFEALAEIADQVKIGCINKLKTAAGKEKLMKWWNNQKGLS